MNAKFAATALAVALIGTPSIAKDKVERPIDGRTGDWAYIGTTHAKHMGDHDTIIIAGPNNRFRALQVRVTGAPLHMRRMRVTYANGVPEDLPIRFNIPQGGRSRNIDLRGGDRKIQQIDFWYDTKGWFKGTADVSVFGIN